MRVQLYVPLSEPYITLCRYTKGKEFIRGRLLGLLEFRTSKILLPIEKHLQSLGEYLFSYIGYPALRHTRGQSCAKA
jgi:hypothetical protein